MSTPETVIKPEAARIVASGALLELGLFVIEQRARNREKVLGPWHPTAAFVLESNAEAYLHQYKSIGYMRLVRPNAKAQTRAEDKL